MRQLLRKRRLRFHQKVKRSSRDASLNKLSSRSHQYRDRNTAQLHSILVPTVSSEQREYIPSDLKGPDAVTTNQAFALLDAPIWNLALIASRLHLVWIKTVCGQLARSEEHTSELQSLMRISYAVFCLKQKSNKK